MGLSIDPALLGTLPANPVPWEQLRAEALATWPGPPVCSESHAYLMRKTMEALEALDLAEPGESGRKITTTEDLTVGLVARFVAAMPPSWSAHTLKSRLNSLRSLCSLAESYRWVTVSPFRIRKVSKWVCPEPPAGKRHLTSDDVRRLLGVMWRDVAEKQGWAKWRARRLYAITSLVAYTALRKMEALCLWVDDIDLPGRVINLTPHGTSLTEDAGPNRRARFKTTASAQPIAVPRALVPVLEDWAAHRLDHPEGFVIPPANRIPWLIPGSNRVGPWVSGPPGLKPGDRLAALGERAGIVGRVTWQILRRTWATRAEALGIPDAMGSRQLRHTTIETTKRWYAQRDLNSLKDAVEGFDY